MENNRDKIKRAKRKVQKLKGFYIHLTVYLLVNSFISISKIVDGLSHGENFGDAIWDFDTFAVWVFWGMGIAFHAVKVFSYNPFLGKDWEERQIQKFMEEDRKESEKYK